MDCLVELYNDDKIANITSIFSFTPKKVILLYDETEKKKIGMDNLKNACCYKIPGIEFEYVDFDSSNIDKVTLCCTNIIHKNPHCFFDITGAGELSVIGMFLACRKTFTPIFKLNIAKNKLVNIYGCNSLAKKFVPPYLTIDTVLAAHGLSVAKSLHPTPPANIYNNILQFCKATFANKNEWKNLCYYLQTASAKHSLDYNKNAFWAPKIIKASGTMVFFPEGTLLKDAQNAQLIYNLDISKNKVSFVFKNETVKKYMTDFGVWLELYCYIKLKQCKLFNDVRLSVKIDWNNTDKRRFMEVTNEIDVTFFYKTRPCFLSCKLSEPTSDTLHELNMYSSYFGGKNSKPFLVVLNPENKRSSYIYRRAKSMKIWMVDGSDINNDRLIGSIKTALNITDI